MSISRSEVVIERSSNGIAAKTVSRRRTGCMTLPCVLRSVPGVASKCPKPTLRSIHFLRLRSFAVVCAFLRFIAPGLRPKSARGILLSPPLYRKCPQESYRGAVHIQLGSLRSEPSSCWQRCRCLAGSSEIAQPPHQHQSRPWLSNFRELYGLRGTQYMLYKLPGLERWQCTHRCSLPNKQGLQSLRSLPSRAAPHVNERLPSCPRNPFPRTALGLSSWV